IGTILPILRERDLLPTAVGAAILNHGAVGEVGPVILMALLLGSRSAWQSLVILLAFLTITLLIVRFTDRVQRAGRRLVEAIHLGGSTTAQTTIRVTILLLVGLCTLAEVFELDVVLGAFAAGFILRYAVPDGDRQLEEKLDGLAYGFFVPLFFVTSGMAIELELTTSSLIYLGAFLVLLVLTRGLPVWVAALLERRRDGSRAYSVRQSLQIAVYSTTALPIIVAVTQVAVDAGAMSASFASTLVLAGALSVLVMPALGLALSSDVDRAPAVEALAVVQGPVEASGRRAENAAEAPQGPLVVSEPRRPAGLAEPSAGPGAPGRDAAGDAADGAGAAGIGAVGPTAPPVPTAEARAGLRRRQRHDLGVHQHGLTVSEARYLAERLAQIEADRAHWRAQMRRQRHLDREEAEQRRAVLRAQNRAHLREERAQLRELRRETARVREEARRRRDAGGPRD
ncbi:MAG: cation:proton antiporter, partial [Actinomyces dentalis]